VRVKFVAGNWKMNGRKAANEALLQSMVPALSALKSVDMAVCPPHAYLGDVAAGLAGSAVALGAQDASEYADGAYTGEVSAGMLKDCGCRYVIVGHSERRTLFGDTDERVAAKFEAVQKSELLPILCVGETLSERESGATEQVVERQLRAVIRRCGTKALSSAVLAYEPVWAIGTGRTATPEQAQAVHGFLRSVIAGEDTGVADGIRILYGGSVKGGNAAALFAMRDIDGGLIGGASLVADEFLTICRAAANQ
jgi:triosephosphate isomerase